MDELRALGHYPKALTAATGCEYNLRKKISRAREAGDFSTAQIAEIDALKIQQKDLADEIMQKIRALGYIPKRKGEHDLLARKYRRAVKLNKISPLQKQEAEALTAAHQASLAQKLGFAT